MTAGWAGWVELLGTVWLGLWDTHARLTDP